RRRGGSRRGCFVGRDGRRGCRASGRPGGLGIVRVLRHTAVVPMGAASLIEGGSRAVTGVWRVRSDPERFDLYTRGSLYFLSAMEPVLAVNLVGAVRAPTPSALLAAAIGFALLHAALCILLVRAGIRHLVDGGPRPDRLRI